MKNKTVWFALGTFLLLLIQNSYSTVDQRKASVMISKMDTQLLAMDWNFNGGYRNGLWIDPYFLGTENLIINNQSKSSQSWYEIALSYAKSAKNAYQSGDWRKASEQAEYAKDLCDWLNNYCGRSLGFWKIKQVAVTNYPKSGSAYIGYEDMAYGDYDYNDFGMNFYVTEIYNENLQLVQVKMTFVALIYNSGQEHLIHIQRPFQGSYTYTISRPTVPAYSGVLTMWDGRMGRETQEGFYVGQGPLDVILFNTEKYEFLQIQIYEEVTITVDLAHPEQNPMNPSLVSPRTYQAGPTIFTDVDPMMANYDPWEEGAVIPYPIHIADTEEFVLVTEVFRVPFILVIPHLNWVPPLELTPITYPYGYFYDFYLTGSPVDWYETITHPNGLSF